MLVGNYKHPQTDEDAYYTLIVKKEGNNLTIKQAGSYPSLTAIRESDAKKLPVLIVYDGKGVLNKKIDSANENDVTWKKNIDFTSFYHTSITVDTKEFISFCRRKQVDAITDDFKNVGFDIVDLYIGPVIATLLYNAINKDEFVSNETRLLFEDGKLNDIEKEFTGAPREYKIGDNSLSAFHLPLYGAAVNYFLKNLDVEKTVHESITGDEIVYRKAFNKLGAGMLVGVFVALLISYIFTQYFIAKNADLNQQNLYSAQTFSQMKILKAEQEQKLKIINDTGQLSQNFISYYSFVLSASVPGKISLGSLEVFPVEGEIKESRKININTRKILVTGTAANEYVLNTWLGTIKKMKWIDTFEILSLKKDKNNCQSFEIKILLNDI